MGGGHAPEALPMNTMNRLIITALLATVLSVTGCDVAAMMRSRGKRKPQPVAANDPLVPAHSEAKAGIDPNDPLARIEHRLSQQQSADAANADEEIEADEDSARDGESDAARSGKRAKMEKPLTFAGLTCPAGTQLYGLPPPKGNTMYCGKSSGLGATVKHGPYIKWDDHGEKRLEANFYDDALDGTVESFHPGEQPMELKEYRHGVQSGRWEKWNRDGEKIADGNFFDGKKDGTFRYYDRTGQVLTEGTFRSNIRSGSWTFYNRQGVIKEKVTYRDGKKNGKAEKYAANGRLLASGAYTDNKPSGVWVNYYGDGRIESRGSYMRGKKDGPWTHFDEAGRVKKNVFYANGMAQRTEGGKQQAHAAPLPTKRSGKGGFVDM